MLSLSSYRLNPYCFSHVGLRHGVHRLPPSAWNVSLERASYAVSAAGGGRRDCSSWKGAVSSLERIAVLATKVQVPVDLGPFAHPSGSGSGGNVGLLADSSIAESPRPSDAFSYSAFCGSDLRPLFQVFCIALPLPFLLPSSTFTRALLFQCYSFLHLLWRPSPLEV